LGKTKPEGLGLELVKPQRLILLGCVLLFSGAVLIMTQVARAQSMLPGKQLTTDAANDLRPFWSPDGKQIVFFSNRAGTYDIWIMNADGSSQRPLTQGPADDRRPSWSPDGKWIVYDSDRSGGRNIWVVSVNGGEPIQVTHDSPLDNFPSWSPDGKHIAYYGYQDGKLDLWLIDVQNLLQGGQASQPRRVTDTIADEKKGQCTFACHTPAWSPDSSQIAYARNNNSEIWVVGMNGGSPHQVVAQGPHEHFPWWTADGRLLLLSERVTGKNETVNDVWSVGSDGSNPTLLYSDIPNGGPFYWDPVDAAEIAFHSPRTGNFDIFTTVLGESNASTAAVPTSEQASPVVTQIAASPEQPQAQAQPSGSGTSGGNTEGKLSPVVKIVLVIGGLLVIFALVTAMFVVVLIRRNRGA
jgi:dipeptidyl aminopeptidase/acylaminoacyl peptidase